MPITSVFNFCLHFWYIELILIITQSIPKNVCHQYAFQVSFILQAVSVSFRVVLVAFILNAAYKSRISVCDRE